MAAEQRRLVGVYASRADAEAVAAAARRAGIAGADIKVGADHRTELLAEMHEEMEQSFISPQGGFAHPKEAAKGASLATAVGAVIGAIVALPLGFIGFSNVPLVVRLLIAAAAGAAAGATIGVIVGPAFVSRGADDHLAAEKGITVSLPAAEAHAADLLATHHPIRIDEVTADGRPVRTVATEDQRDDGGVAQTFAQRLADPEGPLPDSDAGRTT